MKHADADPLEVVAARISQLDAAGETERADEAIITWFQLSLHRDATCIGAERTRLAFHRRAQLLGGSTSAPGLIPDAALVTGRDETDGPAARGLMKVALETVEPLVGERTAKLLAGATLRIDRDAAAETVLTAKAPTHVRGTPEVHDQAVLMTRVLAQRIKMNGAKEWGERLGLKPKELRSVVAIERALLGAVSHRVSPGTWELYKLNQPPPLKMVPALIAAMAQRRPFTPEQEAELTDEDARKVLRETAAVTDPDIGRMEKTLEYLEALWLRAGWK